MPERACLGMSHSPLMGLNSIQADVHVELHHAIATARQYVLEFAPELVVLVAPDHYNGFFNQLMPPFCIGTEARAVGDYLSPAGSLNVDGDMALDLANALMDGGFDIALSRRMEVDHGFSQPMELLWGSLDTPPVLPIFLNAVAPPSIPRLNRCRALGRAIGRFLDGCSRRALVIGSGGLSHEPPVPTLDNPDAAVRERITISRTPTKEERDAKTARVMAAGRSLAAGESLIKALNPQWDQDWMQHIAGNDASLDALCLTPEADIDRKAGHSGHESKTWLVARAALSTHEAPIQHFSYYRAIPEYIAGFGITFLTEPPEHGKATPQRLVG